MSSRQIAPFGAFTFDPGSRSFIWSSDARTILGQPAPATIEELLASVHPEDRDTLAASLERALNERAPLSVIFRPRDPTLDTELALRGGWADDGRCIGILIDLAMDSSSIAESFRAGERFRVGFEHASIGMAVRDLDGRFLMVNAALARFLGRVPEDLIGRRPDEFAHPDDAGMPTPIDQLMDGSMQAYRAERRYLRPDGSLVWGLVNNVIIRQADGSPHYLFGQVQDITDRKRIEADLEHLAHHDPLTGLPNRTLLYDRLNEGIADASERSSRLVVFFLDLDKFKDVNDSLGHRAGDEVLVQVANRISALVQPGDTVARLGGDEFAVICEVPDETTAASISERLLAEFALPIPCGQTEVLVTTSIGIAFLREGITGEDMIREADTAMYRAKEGGRAQARLSVPRYLHRLLGRLRAPVVEPLVARLAEDREVALDKLRLDRHAGMSDAAVGPNARRVHASVIRTESS